MARSTAILPRASGTGTERAKVKMWLDVVRNRFPPPNSGSLVQQARSIEHPQEETDGRVHSDRPDGVPERRAGAPSATLLTRDFALV